MGGPAIKLALALCVNIILNCHMWLVLALAVMRHETLVIIVSYIFSLTSTTVVEFGLLIKTSLSVITLSNAFLTVS